MCSLALKAGPSTDWTNSSECLVLLPPLFKLLNNVSEIGDIERLLEAGLLMYKTFPLVGTYPSEKKIASCHALFYGLNWFRELVNACSLSDQPEVIQNTFTRIENIMELETMLNELVCITPLWTPICSEKKENPVSSRSISVLLEAGPNISDSEDDSGIQSTAVSVCLPYITHFPAQEKSDGGKGRFQGEGQGQIESK